MTQGVSMPCGGDKKGSCAAIPAYCEAAAIAKVVAGAGRHVDKVIVVDDGSPDSTAAKAEEAGARVLRHDRNMGKGAAIRTAFEFVKQAGFETVILMDGDGQHDPGDIPRFLKAYRDGNDAVLVGNRMGDRSKMPLVRRLTNRFMSWLLSREMGQFVPDTQCGFRLFRCDTIDCALPESGRFAAESEILLHVASEGHGIGSVPISAIYGDEKSKINPVVDTVRFFAMLRRYRKSKAGRTATGRDR